MTLKYAPLVATLLLIGSQPLVAATALADEAKAATLDQQPPDAMRIRCFIGTTHDQTRNGRAYEDLGHGWFCMPEEKPVH
jgi:hypothetical protein